MSLSKTELQKLIKQNVDSALLKIEPVIQNRIDKALFGFARANGLDYENLPIFDNLDFSDVSYCLEKAWHFARVSQLAYLSEDIIEYEVERMGPGWSFEVIESESIRVLFLISDEHLVVAPRGTVTSSTEEAIDNFQTNFDFIKTDRKKDGSRIHTGFLEASSSFYDDLTHMLPSKSTVWFTGHSLGGALALILAFLTKNDSTFGKSFETIPVYTYGQPKVGDKVFSKIIDSSVVQHNRIIVEGDPIALLPFQLFSYFHSGEKILITDQGDKKSWKFLRLIRMFYYVMRLKFSRVSKGLVSHYLSYHSLTTYIKNLRNLYRDKVVPVGKGTIEITTNKELSILDEGGLEKNS